MNTIVSLINRHMKKYFRDKGVLIFSLLSVFIVSALYMFFLTDMQIEYIKEQTGDIEGIANLINSWVVAGLVCIPAVSVPLIMLCFKVDDVENKTEHDLNVTPAKRINLMLGYVVSAIIVGFIMTMLCLLLGEIFIVVKGGSVLGFVSMIKVVLMLLLMVCAFTGFEFFIILFIKSNSGVNVANSILNVLLGFLLGLYVPIGMLGNTVGNAIKSFPLMQNASIIRKIMMSESLESVFGGAPEEIVSQVRDFYGVDIAIGSFELTNTFTVVILAAFGIMFYVVSLMIIRFRKEK